MNVLVHFFSTDTCLKEKLLNEKLWKGASSKVKESTKTDLRGRVGDKKTKAIRSI